MAVRSAAGNDVGGAQTQGPHAPLTTLHRSTPQQRLPARRGQRVRYLAGGDAVVHFGHRAARRPGGGQRRQRLRQVGGGECEAVFADDGFAGDQRQSVLPLVG